MSGTISPNSEVHQGTDEPEGIDAESSTQPDVLRELSDALDADFFIFSGPVERGAASKFIDIVEHDRSRTNAALILTTLGGNADAAYIIARYIKRNYEHFFLYVFGPCKSAGSLLALGADQVVMSQRGEFGPLDVQLVRRDDIFFMNSGLDITESLDSISRHAFNVFANLRPPGPDGSQR